MVVKDVYVHKTMGILDDLTNKKDMVKREKCWCCDGKGYHIRIVTGNVSRIEEECYCCGGSGFYDPKYNPPEPTIKL